MLEEGHFDIKVAGRFKRAVQEDWTAAFSSTPYPADICSGKSARLTTAHQHHKAIGTGKCIFIVVEEGLFDIKVVGRFQQAVKEDCTAEFSSTFGPANIYL